MAHDGTLKFDTAIDSSGFQKDTSKLENVVKGLGVFKILEAGFRAVANSVDAAVARYDTLNKFPKVLEQMGFSADEAQEATQRLSDGVQGLPTTLDAVVSTAQRLTVLTGNLQESVDTTLALNNAFLASGSSAADAERGLTQYVQMLSSGKVDMQSWKTLQETMGLALNKTAEAFGFAGESAQNDLYAALRDGDITFKEFNKKIIELNEGIGGFADMAKTSTGGIGIAWKNLQTGIVRGTTEIIKSIDTGLSKTRFKSIENIISTTKDVFVKNLNVIAVAFGFVAENADTLIPVLIAIGATILAWSVIGPLLQGIVNWFQMGGVAVHLFKAALGQAAVTNATLVAGMELQGIVVGVLTGKIGLMTAAKALATKAQLALNAAWAANPIGMVVAGVVALTAILVGLLAIMNKNKSAVDQEIEKMKELSKAHEEYKKQLEEENEAAEQARDAKLQEIATNKKTVQSLQELIDRNKETGDLNGVIADTVGTLNKEMEGLGLTYNSVTGELNMTNAELEAYVGNLEAVQQYQYHQEQYNRLLQQQTEIQQKIGAQQEIEIQYWRKLENGEITRKEYNKFAAESIKLMEEYNETLGELETQTEIAGRAAEAAYNAEAEAAVSATQIRNTQMESVRAFAEQYGLSVDSIIADASRMNGGLTEWAANQAKLYTKSGMDIDLLAERWGVSTEEIKAYMDETGGSLEDYHQRMKKTHTAEGLTLDQAAEKYRLVAEDIKAAAAMQDMSWQEYVDSLDDEAEKAEKIIRDYADEFDMTVEDVRSGIAEMGGDMETWAAQTEQAIRKTQVAEQSHIDQIKAGNVAISASYAERLEARRVNGELLNDIEQATLDQWNAINQQAADAYKAQQQEIIDASVAGASKIKLSKQQSAKDILAIQKANNEATAQYVDNYNFIYEKIPESQRGVLSELDVDSARFLKEMVAKWDKGGKEQWEQYVAGIEESKGTAAEKLGDAVEEVSDTGLNAFEGKEEEFKQAGTDSIDSLGAGMDASTAPSEASQAIADAVVEDMKNADYSGITAAIATAITTGTTDVVSSAKTMSEGVISETDTMKTNATTNTSQMMADMNTEITTGAVTLETTTNSMASALVKIVDDDIKKKAVTLTTQMMTEMNTSIITNTEPVKTSAAALASGVVTQLDTMKTGAKTAMDNVMAALLKSMEDSEQKLYNKAKQIADRISKTLKDAWDEHSPSKVAYGIMDFFMRGMYNAMDDMEGTLIGKALRLADSLTDTLTISPAVGASLTGRLQAIVETPPFSMSTLNRLASPADNPSAGTTYVINFYQTINSDKYVSPSESSREAEDMLRRYQHQIP